MTTRLESRFGEAKAVGTTYTNVFTVTSSHTYNTLIHIANLTAGDVKVRAYIATNSWSSGEPTGSTLKATIMYDATLAANEFIDQTGLIFLTGEKFVVYCDTASGVDVSAHGVDIV